MSLKEVVRQDFTNARKTGDVETKNALEAIIADILKKEKTQDKRRNYGGLVLLQRACRYGNSRGADNDELRRGDAQS